MVYYPLGLVLMWTFIEYVQHRFILHGETKIDKNGPPDPEYNANIFSWHLQHHVFMNQWYRVPISVGRYCRHLIPIQLVLYFFIDKVNLLLLTCGIITGCLLYDAIHLSFHHG